MRNMWVKRLFRGVLILILALMSVSVIGKVKANALADGTYTVPVESINKDTGLKSASQAYLGSTGDLTVNNGTYTVSVPILPAGQSVLKSATYNGSSILNGQNLTFTLTGETSQVEVGYHIVVTMPGNPKPLIDMSPSAYERFDWTHVESTGGNQPASVSQASQSTNADKTDLNKNSTEAQIPQVKTLVKQDGITYYQFYVTNPDATVKNIGEVPVPKDIKDGTTPVIDTDKDTGGHIINIAAYYITDQGEKKLLATVDNNLTHVQPAPTVQAPATSTNVKTNQGSAVSPLTNVSKLNYTVLQSNDKSISEANKYYTHVADVEKLSNGSYKVTMHVQYGKNSGMSAKGFVPLTVNDQKVSDVTYGSTDKDYTASFSFTAKSLDELVKAPVKGTIHVSVPMMGISSEFDVYYKFGAPAQGSSNSSSQNSSKAAEVPGKTSQAPAKANVAKKTTGELPQTSELQNITAAAIGVVSLILISAIVIYRRKRA